MRYTRGVRTAIGASACGFLLTLLLASTGLVGQAPVNVTGTWSGTASDRWVSRGVMDGMRVTWQLTQTGTAVAGTVTSTNLVLNDRSCSSCHRVKSGTVSGTNTGTTLSLTMTFPGISGEVTAQCSSSFTGTASPLAATGFTFLYTGADSCEGLFQDGILEVGAGGPAAPTIAGQPVTQAVSSGQLVTLGVTVLGTPPLGYQWYRGRSGVLSDPVSGATTSTYVTGPITAFTQYWVRVSNYFGATASSTASLDIARGFTDDVLVSSDTTVRAVHVTELRSRVDALRTRFGLPLIAYSDPVLTAGTTAVRAQHVDELRARLTDVYLALERPAPAFTHAILTAGPIRRIDVIELRAAVVAIE